MAFKALEPEEYLLVCTSEWHDRSLEDILQNERIIDFDPDDRMTVNYLKENDLYHHVQLDRHYVNRTEFIAEMLISKFSYGLLTKEFCESLIDSGELIVLNEGKVYEFPLVLAWYPRHKPPTYFSALIDAIS